MPSNDLKTIFEFVEKNGPCTARQIGRVISGGKSRANHYLYGYSEILFVKRGLTPPQWRIVSDDAYSQMLGRVTSTPTSSIKKIIPVLPSISHTEKYLRPRDLPAFSVCQSCDLPIQPTGKCGCS